MTTPEADPADLTEQLQTPARDAADVADATLPLEAPEADVLEQSTDATPGEQGSEEDRELPLEADDLDAAEQAVVVEHDADEYR